MIGFDFTLRLRSVLGRAREEAVRLNHPFVETEHILLALIREVDGGSAVVLRELDIAPEKIRQKLEETLVPGPPMLAGPDLPYTARAKKVLELTLKECVRAHATAADTEYLLVGLCAEEKGIAAQTLAWAGLTTEIARAAVDKLTGVSAESSPSSARATRAAPATKRRKVIVRIATSADGYIARPDGDLEWLTSYPAPRGFYGYDAFMKSIDTELLGRKTYDESLRLGAKFEGKTRAIVFSHGPRPADAPAAVEFVNDDIGRFVERMREQPGKDIWLMGGGELIASFLDAQAIDELSISVFPVFIGDGIPLIARRHRHVPLELLSAEPFENGVVQLHYRVP